MKLHVFTGRGNFVSVSEDEKGTNLPADNGPWKYWKRIDVDRKERSGRISASAAEILDAIQANGFFLNNDKAKLEGY
jgi:hypothetical protein